MASNEDKSECPEALVRVQKCCLVFVSPESKRHALEFNPGPSDVIICTAPRSGTTIMQQICHGLRSGGDMNFDEIDLVIPNVLTALDGGIPDINQTQAFQPQMFKIHLAYEEVPKGGGKHIVIVRRPSDVALSLYYFLKGWVFEDEDNISIGDFVEWFYLKGGNVKGFNKGRFSMHHLTSWYPHRRANNVLWLHFEDILENLRECVKLVAEFLDIGAADDELQELVTKQASFEFMKNHPTKFDEHHMKLARNEAVGLPRHAGLRNNHNKVRAGRLDEGKKCIPKHILEKIDDGWIETVASATGYKTYEDLRKGVNKELNRGFS